MGAHLSGPAATATLVEVVGPPGAGKSSVVAAISDREARVRVQGAYRRLRHLPAYGLALAATSPVLVRSAGSRGVRRLRPANRVVRVQASARVLTAGPPAAIGAVVVVDQGPIYGLARLDADGVAWSGPLGRWRDRMLEHWSTRLDLVVVLDAPTDVLVERIRTRAKAHAAKDGSAEEIGALVEHYRSAFEELIANLVERGSTTVCRIDTRSMPVEAAAATTMGAVTSVEARRRPAPRY